MAKKDRVIMLVGIVLGLGVLLRTILLIWNSSLLDFSIFYYASQSILTHTNPYTNPLLFTQASYPPITFLIFISFTIISLKIASQIWIILSALSFFLALFFLYKIKPISYSILSLLLLANVLSFPFKFTLGMGQINLLLLLLLVLFLYFWGKHTYLSAFMISLSILVKLFPVFLLIYFLLKRKYLFLIMVCSVLVIFISVSMIYSGVDIYIYYIQNIFLPVLTKPAGAVYYNQSVTGFFARLHAPAILLFIARMSLILITLYKGYISKANIYSVISIFLTTILLINSFTWQHHLVLLLIPFYFLFTLRNTKQELFYIMIAYLFVSINFTHPTSFPSSFLSSIILSHGFLGMLLLWYIQLRHLSKKVVEK